MHKTHTEVPNKDTNAVTTAVANKPHTGAAAAHGRYAAATVAYKPHTGAAAARGRYAAAALKSDAGSVTLESAIAVPIIIFVVCLSVYIVLLLFEHAQLQSSSGYAAHRASSVWLSGGLYRRLHDPDSDTKRGAASRMAQQRLESVSLPEGYTRADGETEYNNGIFGKTLTVGLRGGTRLPNRRVTSVFGLVNTFDADFETVSLMPDFAENIRCIGYVLEIEQTLEADIPELGKAVNSFNGVISNIREYIGGIL